MILDIANSLYHRKENKYKTQQFNMPDEFYEVYWPQ